MSTSELLIILTGCGLVLMALLVEIEHKIIWKHYTRDYQPHKNKLLDKLLRPNKAVYAINVYVLWPLVLILGVAILLRGVI